MNKEKVIEKFKTLTKGIISNSESERFLSNVQKLKKLKSNQLNSLNIEVRNKKLDLAVVHSGVVDILNDEEFTKYIDDNDPIISFKIEQEQLLEQLNIR